MVREKERQSEDDREARRRAILKETALLDVEPKRGRDTLLGGGGDVGVALVDNISERIDCFTRVKVRRQCLSCKLDAQYGRVKQGRSIRKDSTLEGTMGVGAQKKPRK